MSSFCCTEIWARWASNAVDSRASSESTVSATRDRWSATSRKNGAGLLRHPGHGAGGEPAQRLAQRQHRPAYLGDLPLQRVDPRGVVGAVGREHRRLDLVDVDHELVDDREVPVDDPVEHGVQHAARPVAQHLGRGLELRAGAVQLVALAVPDRHDEVVADEERDLAGLDGVLARRRTRAS